MAGSRKSGGRIEPSFEGGRSRNGDDDFRLSDDDRVTTGGKPKSKKANAERRRRQSVLKKAGKALHQKADLRKAVMERIKNQKWSFFTAKIRSISMQSQPAEIMKNSAQLCVEKVFALV